MLRSAYSMAVEHVGERVDRSNSDHPAAADVLDQNVKAALRASTAAVRNQGANAAPQPLFTNHKQHLGAARIIGLPPAPTRSAPAASFHALQEWEGYVLSADTTSFVARLVDVTTRASHEEEEAVIPRAELSESDNAKMRVGSIFRWVIGYERARGGTKRRVSQFVFRDLPAITSSDLREGEAWARKMARSLNP